MYIICTYTLHQKGAVGSLFDRKTREPGNTALTAGGYGYMDQFLEMCKFLKRAWSTAYAHKKRRKKHMTLC